jgi:hypothetical protein
MEVRVIKERSSAVCSEADYVRVQTWCDPEQDTVTLATIERVVHKAHRKPSSAAQRVKTLVQKQPMSPDDALGFATRYAESKKIPLVLASAENLTEIGNAGGDQKNSN